MKVRRWLVAGILFGILWVFVKGTALALDSLAASLVLGTTVGLPVAFVFRRLYEREIDISQPVTALPYILLYGLNFSREIVVANLDVSYRVLAPNLPLEPQVILVPLRVETSVGITTIANSITITPGTITLDHDPDENALYVHVIDGRNPSKLVEPIRQWENYALEIFDEENSPDDPAPEITIHPPDYPPEPKTVTEPREQLEETPDETGTDNDVDPERENDGR